MATVPISSSSARPRLFDGRKEVTVFDILRVAEMAVGFRTRREGFEEPAAPEEVRRVFTAALREKGLMEAPSTQ